MELVVGFKERSRREKLAMNLDIVVPVRRLPAQLVWLVMEKCSVSWVGDRFPDDRHKRTMIKVVDRVIFRPWVIRAAVKRH